MNVRDRSASWIPTGMIFLLACSGAGPIRAEDPAPAPTATASEDAPGVAAAQDPGPVVPGPTLSVSGSPSRSPGKGPGLDSLLTLPEDRSYTVERRGGLTSGEWRAKFDRVRADLVKAETALEDAEGRMDEAAERGQWQVAPPIPGQNQTAPGETTLNFKLRQEIRRHRAEIARLESQMQDLEIEANLASVPDDWRG